MSSIFGDYPEIANEATTANESFQQAMVEDATKPDLKKIERLVKKINKRSKRANKRMKKKEVKGKAEGKSFLKKIGNVFLETLPMLLTTAVTVAVKTIIGRFSKTTCYQRQVTA